MAQAAWVDATPRQDNTNLLEKLQQIAIEDQTEPMNRWAHQFRDRDKEHAYRDFCYKEARSRGRVMLVPWLLLALVQTLRAHARGAEGPELATLWVPTVAVVCALAVLTRWPRVNVLHEIVTATSTVSSVCAFAALYFSTDQIIDACNDDPKCLSDFAAGRGLAIGILYCAFAVYGGVMLRIFRHFALYTLTLDAAFVLFFVVLRDDIGDAHILSAAGVLLITGAMVTLNRTIDWFFRKEFLWYQRTLAMTSDHLEQMQAEKVYKQRVVGYLFHEVRNPINNIVLAAAEGLALLDLLPDHPDDDANSDPDRVRVADVREMGEIISQAASTASHVLDDALSLEKLEAGNFAFVRQPFAFEELYGPTTRTVTPNLTAKDLQLDVDVDAKLHTLKVEGDVKRLRQVLHNYLSNAIKFTPHGGRILVQLRALEWGLTTVLVRVAVSDTGIGVPLEDQKRLFAPWSQVRAAETQGGGGTGLGLSLSKDFVQRGHNGRVGMKSPGDLGTGSTFFFEIEFVIAARDNAPPVDSLASPPLSPRQVMHAFSPLPPRRSEEGALATERAGLSAGASLPAVPPPPKDQRMALELARRPIPSARSEPGEGARTGEETPSDAAGSARQDEPSNEAPAAEAVERDVDVLLVDDSQITCKLVSRMLTAMRVSHDMCENGRLAVDRARATRYKLILMDKEMPVMDGHEACAAIRKFDKDVVIVGVTGNAMDSQQAEFRAHGANDVLPKPINKQLIADVLRKYGLGA